MGQGDGEIREVVMGDIIGYDDATQAEGFGSEREKSCDIWSSRGAWKDVRGQWQAVDDQVILVIAQAEGGFAEEAEERIFGGLLVFGFDADEENGSGRGIRIEEEFGSAAAKRFLGGSN